MCSRRVEEVIVTEPYELSNPYQTARFLSGHPLDSYKLDEEIISLIHLLRLQVIPMNRTQHSWVWEVKSCHSDWCIDIPSNATTADWKKHLAALIEARSK